MAYSLDDIVAMIDKAKSTNPAMAYAIYNGLSGMGGGVSDPGALTIALRNKWGEQAARDFVNNGQKQYGNSMFVPDTGEWGGWGDAYGQGGKVEGWDPKQFDSSLSFSGSYNPPGGTGTYQFSTGTAAPGGNQIPPGGATYDPNAPTTGAAPTPRSVAAGAPTRTGNGTPTPTQPGGPAGHGGIPTTTGPDVLQMLVQQILGQYGQRAPRSGTVRTGGPTLPGASPYPNINKMAGSVDYTYTGLPLRAFDPSLLLRDMRQHYGAAGGAGQVHQMAPPPANALQNNLQQWDQIFSRG